jgi:hypothetical protein
VLLFYFFWVIYFVRECVLIRNSNKKQIGGMLKNNQKKIKMTSKLIIQDDKDDTTTISSEIGLDLDYQTEELEVVANYHYIKLIKTKTQENNTSTKANSIETEGYLILFHMKCILSKMFQENCLVSIHFQKRHYSKQKRVCPLCRSSFNLDKKFPRNYDILREIWVRENKLRTIEIDTLIKIFQEEEYI